MFTNTSLRHIIVHEAYLVEFCLTAISVQLQPHCIAIKLGTLETLETFARLMLAMSRTFKHPIVTT